MFDLGPASTEMSRLVKTVDDGQLDGRTPCDEWRVRQLLEHVLEFSTVFTLNARKEPIRLEGGLPDDWRDSIPTQLEELARAWSDESAWQGQVSAGGIEMTAEQNALVAAEELVLHGWDLAAAIGHDLRVRDEDLVEVERFQDVFAEPIASGQGPYGPAVAVADDATRMAQVLGVAGRDPAWSRS